MVENPLNELRHVPVSADPRYPGGAKQGSLDGSGAYSQLMIATVLHVDTETMVCSIRVNAGGGIEKDDVPIPAFGGGGPRCWAGNMIERGSRVLIGWKKYSEYSFKPYIIQAVTVGVYPGREFEPFSSVDPKDAEEALRMQPDLADDPRLNIGVTRMKLRKVYSGDFLASSSSGSDIVLDSDVIVTNRAGNEFRLRDADQTAILQSNNVFESNAAGYYRRGLVKRNAFNFLPDLASSGYDLTGDQSFDDFIDGKFIVSDDDPYEQNRYLVGQVPVDSPAYARLLEFGLINEEGIPVFKNDPDDLFYPFIVTDDGQRISYVTEGEHEIGFDSTEHAYTEDRRELRHVHDGIMAVTEEADGVQIDRVAPAFIEDVIGTVVGNDPYSDAGRPFYKKILTMGVFDDPEDASPSTGPKFEAVDTVTSQTEADTKALCRLFHVRSPNTSNQYAFGISKEGRVFLHVPKSVTGKSPQEKGKSVDASFAGLVKTVIGKDDNTGYSLDCRTKGGVKLDIGTNQGPDSEVSEQVSVDLTLRGKIRTTYLGRGGRETILTGSDFRSTTGSSMDLIDGNCIRQVGGEEAVEAFSVSHNAGAGGYKFKCGGDAGYTVLGKTMETYAQLRQSTFALSDTKIMLAGVDSTTVFTGAISRTVIAGTIADTITTGAYALNVATGNISMAVATGNIVASVGTGNLVLTAGGGNIALTAGIATVITSTATVAITSPATKTGVAAVGGTVAGAPGPGSPHIDYITGLPILGLPHHIIG
jgi:hypothetical protein